MPVRSRRRNFTGKPALLVVDALEPFVSSISRRLAALVTSAALAVTGLAVTSSPASAFDPTNPMGTCGPGVAAAPWDLRELIATDAAYKAADTKPLTVTGSEGLRRKVLLKGYGDAKPKPLDEAALSSGRFLLYQAPARGTVSLDESGSFTYTANVGVIPPSEPPGMDIPDSFAYFFQYNDLCSTVATVRIGITERTDTAIAAPDHYFDDSSPLSGFDFRTRVPAEDGVLANDQTPESQLGSRWLRSVQTSQLFMQGNRPGGTVDLAADGSFRVYPADNARFTTFYFTYKACPIFTTRYSVTTGGCSADQTVRLDLPPSLAATGDHYAMTPGSTTLRVDRGYGLLRNDGVYGDQTKLSWKVLTPPKHGTIDVNAWAPIQANDGAFRYVTADDFPGSDSFTYVRCVLIESTTHCSPSAATVTITRSSAPRLVSVTAPAPTSGDPFVIDLSEPVSGVSTSTVTLTGPDPLDAPVPVSLACQVVLKPSPTWPAGAIFSSPCDAPVSRITLTPSVPLMSPAPYTLSLNPSNAPMPGTDTGLRLEPTSRTLTVDAPQGAPPRITAQPENMTVRPGSAAMFTAAALGHPEPDAIWETSTDGGGTWTELPTKVGSTLVVSKEDAVDGHRFRIRFTNRFGTVVSRVATLAVGSEPVVTLHPKDRANQSATTSFYSFTAAADGIPAPDVQWEESTDGGGTWTDVPDATSNTLTRIGAGTNGTLFRARFSNTAGTVHTNPAEVFVFPGFLEPPTVTDPPEDVLVYAYDVAKFSTSVSSGAALQWQWRLPGSDEFEDVPYSTSPTLEIEGDPSISGTLVRVEARNAAGRVYSAPATLTVTARPVATPPTVTQDPADVTVAEGADAHFSVEVAGSPAPYVLWQSSTDGGESWTLDQVQSGSSFALEAVTLDQDGLRVRALALSAGGTEFSEPAVLTVTPDPLPTLSLPGTIDVVATSAGGATVNYSTSATDNDPVAPAVTCSPPSGSLFPVGQTAVSCSAEDARGQVATGTFLVRVASPVPDTSAPVLGSPPQLAPAPNAAGWSSGPVTVRWAWSDAGAGIDPARCTTRSVVTKTGTVSATCTDKAGNKATSPTTSVRIDAVAPTLAPGTPQRLLLGAPTAVDPRAADQGGSGLASVGCARLTTATLGTRTLTCTATDKAGNRTRVSRKYTVLASVSKFQRPKRSKATVKRGKLTVRFTLAGDRGRLSSAASAALGSKKAVRVALTGRKIAGGSPLLATCTWSTRASSFTCRLALPKRLASGKYKKYKLAVQLRTAKNTWLTAPGGKRTVSLRVI